MVDITLLVATSRALRVAHPMSEFIGPKKIRRKLRDEIKRGALAYLKALARTQHGCFDQDMLASCRLAAEQERIKAMAATGPLRQLMTREAGALAGLASLRHDLWRLSRMAIFLRQGATALRNALTTSAELKAANGAIRHLQKGLRRALLDYALASLRGGGGSSSSSQFASDCRGAAQRRLTLRCQSDADRLSALADQVPDSATPLQRGVAQALRDIRQDWAL